MLRKEQFDYLDYSKMVPSFIGTILDSKSDLVISFLNDHVISRIGCREKSVHNMLFYFYTRVKDLERMKTFLLELEARKEQK